MELNNSRAEVISRMQSRMVTIDQFNWDRMMAPPLYSLITQEACNEIYRIATSVRYSGNATKRYKLIDDVLKPFGFEKKGAGTNRVVYKYLENDSFLLKVATDAIGIGDNPREFKNQFIFKPFVTKIFEVDPTGAVALVERVVPITSREEFLTCASNIYDVIRDWFIGDYILADIGTKFFMNWGIRKGFGPVLLDFPYAYELDGNKLFCNETLPDGTCCCGEIDYDDGYNFLWCQKCGKRYRVQQLAKATTENKIIMKGRASKMKISMTIGGNVVKSSNNETEIMRNETDCIKKVNRRHTSQAPIGNELKISVGMVPAKQYNRKQENNQAQNKVENKPKKENVDHSSNGVNNRGIVRATPAVEQTNEAISMDKYSALEKDLEELKVKYAKLEQDFKDKDEELTGAYADYDKMEKMRDEKLKEVTNLEKENEELKTKLKITEDKLAKLDVPAEMTNNSDELESKEETHSQDIVTELILKKENISLKNEINRLNEDLKKAKDEIEAANRAKSDFEHQLADLKTNINDTVNMLKNSRDSESKIQAEFNTYKENYAKIEAENKELKETVETLRQHIQNIDNEEASDSVVLPISSDSLLREEGREEYSDTIRSVEGINALKGELTTLNTINLINNGDLIDEDQYVIAIVGDDGDYIKDQEGNILCMYAIDNIQVPEVFENEDIFNTTAAKVELIRINGNKE